MKPAVGTIRRPFRRSPTTDLSVTGKPVQFGRGVMQDVSDILLGQFVACIESQFAVAEEPFVPQPPVDAVSPDVVAPAPSAPPVPAPAVPRLASVPAVDDSIDLGATVLPVLIKSDAPHAVAGLIGVLIGWLLARRRTS